MKKNMALLIVPNAIKISQSQIKRMITFFHSVVTSTSSRPPDPPLIIVSITKPIPST